MNLTDTHAHLYWDSFKEDFDDVIKRALDAGVSTIINVGVDVRKSKIDYTQKDIINLEQIYLNNPQKVVAVGECGLDFKEVDEQTKSTQRKLFQDQIDLAKKLNLPLIVHCREAWDETIEMTKDHFGIYHCYSGQPPTTSYLLQTTNFLISFAGNLTYPKNDYLREAVKILPMDRIVLETDCPFLPPQSKRGKRNEPSFMLENAQMIARLKEISLAEIARQTTKNTKEILRLRSG
ncbi:TatD family hydrolase [Candidatus Daviesbacteria bacterium]|nr:TatD family hydrolase [Candidatus Daviesbacteria bacterium]